MGDTKVPGDLPARVTRVAILTGGSTAERDVAFAGAAQVLESLRDSGLEVTVIDTVEGVLSTERVAELLKPDVDRTPPPHELMREWRSREEITDATQLPEIREVDLVFLILHGHQGEGGDIQGRLEALGVKFTGSDSAGSRNAMDKLKSKEILQRAGIRVPRGHSWPVDGATIADLGLPLIVKPSRVGSTLGLTLVHSLAELEPAVEFASQFDDEIIVEQYLAGREFTVGVLGDRPLAVGEIIPQHEIFDYECKYTPGMSEEIFPASLDEPLTRQLKDWGVLAHRALGLRHFSRVDFKVGSNGELFCLEANTLPGLTRASLLPQSAAAAGINFDTLCAALCDLALENGA
ncbi:MAG: D-alanine--D-alanine ligase [Gemmatimonadales bacterium]